MLTILEARLARGHWCVCFPGRRRVREAELTGSGFLGLGFPVPESSTAVACDPHL